MSFTKTDVLAVAAEFSAVTDPQWALWIAMTERQLNRAVLGARADDVGVFLCAHLMTKFGASGAGTGAGSGGPVVSEKVGEVSVTGAQVKALSGTDAWMFSTGYGASYMRLVKLAALTPFVPGGSTLPCPSDPWDCE